MALLIVEGSDLILNFMAVTFHVPFPSGNYLNLRYEIMCNLLATATVVETYGTVAQQNSRNCSQTQKTIKK